MRFIRAISVLEQLHHSNFHEWHHAADDLSEYCLHNLSYGSGDFGGGSSHLSGPYVIQLLRNGDL
jgi:hypothetical protein